MSTAIVAPAFVQVKRSNRLAITNSRPVTSLTAAVVRYVLDHNTVYGFDRLWLAAREQFPTDLDRARFGFRSDLRTAVRLSLEPDCRGPLGAWMLCATLSGEDWVAVSEELADLWDDEHLSHVAADMAAEAEADRADAHHYCPAFA